MSERKLKDLNVLTLDGGGVRGLSTLLILKELMRLINGNIDAQYRNGRLLEPTDIFDLVVGTSTGGLIALMLVKLDLSVDQCLDAYKILSKKIFGRWDVHVFGQITFGLLGLSKFSGRNFRKVLIKHVIQPALTKLGHTYTPKNFRLEDIARHQDTCCAVVCRELDRATRRRKQHAVVLCSHRADLGAVSPCHHLCPQREEGEAASRDTVKVADAARATSAAPSYFPHVEIIGKLLVDGGYGETNNPSLEAWSHFFEQYLEDYERIQFVNIGTGSEPTGYKGKKVLIPTVKDLETIATMSDNVGRYMRILQNCSSSKRLQFGRFSENIGAVHAIKLSDYKKLEEIEELTYTYLGYECERNPKTKELSKTFIGNQNVCQELKQIADELARTYMTRREPRQQEGHQQEAQQTPTIADETPASLDNSNQPSLQAATLNMSQTLGTSSALSQSQNPSAYADTPATSMGTGSMTPTSATKQIPFSNPTGFTTLVPEPPAAQA